VRLRRGGVCSYPTPKLKATDWRPPVSVILFTLSYFLSSVGLNILSITFRNVLKLCSLPQLRDHPVWIPSNRTCHETCQCETPAMGSYYTFIVTECQLAAATCQVTCDLARTNCRANRIVCPVCCVQHIDTSGQVKIDCTMCVCLNSLPICLLLHEVILFTCVECGLSITWPCLYCGYTPNFCRIEFLMRRF